MLEAFKDIVPDISAIGTYSLKVCVFSFWNKLRFRGELDLT